VVSLRSNIVRVIWRGKNGQTILNGPLRIFSTPALTGILVSAFLYTELAQALLGLM
jgi:hypothetical protein